MIRDAVRYLRGRPDLMMVLSVVFFAGTFGLNFQMTSALMATQVFHKGATEYGLLGSTMAIGSLTGALMAARRTRIRLRLVAGAALLFGVVEIVAGLMPTYLTYVAIVPFLGFTALTMITAANTTMQLATAPGLRGRVMALYLMVFMGGTPLGSPFIGWIGEQFGARWTLIGGGGLTILGVLASVAVFTRGRGMLQRRVVTREVDDRGARRLDWHEPPLPPTGHPGRARWVDPDRRDRRPGEVGPPAWPNHSSGLCPGCAARSSTTSTSSARWPLVAGAVSPSRGGAASS